MGKKSSSNPGMPNYGSSQPAGPQTNWRPPAANGWGSPMRYAPRQAPVPQAPVPQAALQAPPAEQPVAQEAPRPVQPQSPMVQASTTETSLAPEPAPAALTPVQAQQQHQQAVMQKYSPVSRILRNGFQSGNR